MQDNSNWWRMQNWVCPLPLQCLRTSDCLWLHAGIWLYREFSHNLGLILCEGRGILPAKILVQPWTNWSYSPFICVPTVIWNAVSVNSSLGTGLPVQPSGSMKPWFTPVLQIKTELARHHETWNLSAGKKQEDLEFVATLSYIVNSSTAWAT